MAKKSPVWLSILLLPALLASACRPESGVFEVAVAPAAETQPARAELDALRPLAIVLLAGLPEDRLSFYEYLSTACTRAEGLGGPPKCRAGEADGQIVRAFPIGGSEGSFLRPEEIGQISDLKFGRLAAVFRPLPGPNPEPYWPEGDLALLFERQENGATTPLVVHARGDRILRLDYPAAANAQEVLDGVPVENVILPPAEAQAWSEPLQALSVVSQSTASDDRRWLAHSMAALPPGRDQPYYHRLVIESQDGATRWTVVDEWAQFASGYSIPFPHAWSRDGRTLYWTFTPTPDGCRVYVNGSDLHRLDLRSGVSTLLTPADGLWVALSPDEGRVATLGPNGLTLHDLASGAQQRIALPEGFAGQMVWAPDGRALALTVAHDACGPSGVGVTSVLRVDTTDLTVTPLIERDARGFATLDWSLLGSILVADRDGQTWQMDPSSGELRSTAEATPAPGGAANAAQTTIRFYASAQPEDRRVFDALAQEFSRRNPQYRIEYAPEPQIDYKHYDANRYIEALSATCDCFSDASLPLEFQQREQLLLDLAPLAQQAGVKDDFRPNQLAYFEYDERLYGLPLTVRPEVIAYNADLLETLGLAPPAADWSFADFLELTQAVVAKDAGGSLYGFGVAEAEFEFYLAGLTGPVIDLSGALPAVDFGGAQAAAGFERLVALRRSRALLVLPGVVYADADTFAAARAWANGQVALWVSPAGQPPVWYVLDEGEAQPGFRVGYAPMPQLPAGVAAQTQKELWSMAGQNYYILKDSPNRQGCWEWYRFLAENGAEAGAPAYLGLPARRSAAASPAVDAALGAGQAGAFRAAVERFYAEAVYSAPPAARPLRIWLLDAARAVLQGAEPAAALAEAQRKAGLFLACVETTGAAAFEQVTACARQADPQTNW